MNTNYAREEDQDDDDEYGDYKVKGRKDAFGREVESFRSYRKDDGKRSRRKDRKVREKRNFEE